jgi:hypothetical protein
MTLYRIWRIVAFLRPLAGVRSPVSACAPSGRLPWQRRSSTARPAGFRTQRGSRLQWRRGPAPLPPFKVPVRQRYEIPLIRTAAVLSSPHRRYDADPTLAHFDRSGSHRMWRSPWTLKFDKPCAKSDSTHSISARNERLEEWDAFKGWSG